MDATTASKTRKRKTSSSANDASSPSTQRAHVAFGVPAGIPLFLQRSALTVNAPGDVYEQEADRMADRVMRQAGPISSVNLTSSSGLQRCACGGMVGEDGECAACRQRRLAVQRKTNSAPGGMTAPASVLLTGGGHALSPTLRAYFEPRFNYDFSRVRLHTDEQAAVNAHSVQARAFTTGHDIVFGAGEYRPHTQAGQRLLAHELTHVVQQNNLPTVLLQRQSTGVHFSPFDNPAAREGVARIKWSEESEQMYRNSGAIAAANAIRACRLQGGTACARILTETEANTLAAQEGQGATVPPAATAAPIAAGLMSPMLSPGPGLPPGLPPTGPIPPLPPIPGSGGLSGLATGSGAGAAAAGASTTATTATATGGTVATGTGVALAELLPPVAVGIYLLAATYGFYRYTAAQQRLIERGYIILATPLAVCISGCHQPTLSAPTPSFRWFEPFPSFGRLDQDTLRQFLQSSRPGATTATPASTPSSTPNIPVPWILPPTPAPFPWWDLGRQQRQRRNIPGIEPFLDPLTGEPYETSNPCHDSPFHECSVLGYPFGSFAAALANLQSRHSNIEPGSTESSTSGDCFKDGRPRSRVMASIQGATHTTYRTRGVSGPEGVVASIVCCNCCIPPVEGALLPSYQQRCEIVKERSRSSSN